LGAARLREYVELEWHDGARWIGSTGRVESLASFAPVGPAEIRGFVAAAASPEQLDDPAGVDVANGLSRVLRLYAALGFQTFNLAIYGVPDQAPESLLMIRLVGRAYFGP
jgi:galactose-1-phosphate uridylyltransferase